MLSNAYFLAKFRFVTAEDEPAKNLQKKMFFFLAILLILLILLTWSPQVPATPGAAGLGSPADHRTPLLRDPG